jgi:hypothetical protein
MNAELALLLLIVGAAAAPLAVATILAMHLG